MPFKDVDCRPSVSKAGKISCLSPAVILQCKGGGGGGGEQTLFLFWDSLVGSVYILRLIIVGYNYSY